MRVQETQAQIFDRNGNRVADACAGCLTVGGNLKYRSSNWPTGYIFAHTWNASASYVTGAHNMKFGYQGAFHRDDDNLFPTISNEPARCSSPFNTPGRRPQRRVAQRHTVRWRPASRFRRAVFTRKVRTQYYAFFAQEQWTRDRLTLQGALRFDHAWSNFPEQTIGPSPWIPNAIVLPAQLGIEGYNDISPRVGVRLRPVRQRQDVGQGQRRPLSASGIEPGPLHQRQPVGARRRPSPTARGRTTTATSSRTATS